MHHRPGEEQAPVRGHLLADPGRQLPDAGTHSRVGGGGPSRVDAGDVRQAADQQRENGGPDRRQPRRRKFERHAQPGGGGQYQQAGGHDRHALKLHVGQADRPRGEDEQQEEQHGNHPAPQPLPRHDPHAGRSGHQHQRIDVHQQAGHQRAEAGPEARRTGALSGRGLENMFHHRLPEQRAGHRRQQGADHQQPRPEEPPTDGGPPPAPPGGGGQQAHRQAQQQHGRPLTHEEEREEKPRENAPRRRGTAVYRRVEEGERRGQQGAGEGGSHRAEMEHPDEVEPATTEHQQAARQRARP